MRQRRKKIVEDGDEIILTRTSGGYVVFTSDESCATAGLGVKFQKKKIFFM
jgi:hypothetical protein